MKVLVLGSGQLARMMALAGAPLNIEVLAYDVGTGHVVHPLTQQVMLKGLNTAITYANVITAEFEHIPHDILDACEASGKLLPTTTAIKAGGDRRLEKKLLDRAEVANAKYQLINNRDDLERAIETVGIPMVLKSALGGYDGKGQWRLKSSQDIEPAWQEIETFLTATPDQAIVAEEFVPFDREVSLIGARGKDGSIAIYPLTENIHCNGVLGLSVAQEENQALQDQAESMFRALAGSLNYVGVLAIEFFEVEGKLLVNEIAPRVHNSGHWTQQGAETCQFENHLRAVCGMPLGSMALIRPTAMVNILGEDSLAEAVMTLPQCHLHWYGKEKRPGRKMGHINVCASSSAELKTTLTELAGYLDPAAFPALNQ
ncbi:5-(carboxyamino)imidazole ribonucleotide synthase [Photobacterium sp. SDRW27]|uniref:5-(carboxyamino)imidazole ribonucleotide synthase n=1 Tax=Photobacterium obscurum TaxID=2829490 RepID=UPI0022436A67|nr:5-(carboxyamino)imidazole ribonucleotide synthase [Photobacterium obscurum]MCW8331450.1 5-(carboxyamino)imidazole ribonucleotide synthase [Photobacterium obscurum]